MNVEERTKFNEANKAIHKVEDQWHYPIMMEKGYEALTKEGVGFVRSYLYKKGDMEVKCTTGYSADHWSNNEGGYGYWGSLKSSL